jgi:hypothetical protein
MRVAPVVAVFLLLQQPAFARDPSNHQYYRSSDRSLVHGPTREENATYGPITADCRDGTHSYSHHRTGTCSGHGGVAKWREQKQ